MAESSEIVVLTIDDDVSREKYCEFIGSLREKAAREKIREVGILPEGVVPKNNSPQVEIRFESIGTSIIVKLFIDNCDLYMYGVKVGNYDWYELSNHATGGNSHFSPSIPIGFGESYGAMGFQTDDSLEKFSLGSGKLIKAIKKLKTHSEGGKTTFQRSLKESIATICVMVSEASRNEDIHKTIADCYEKTGTLGPQGVSAIKSWSKEQDKFYEDPYGYNGQLKLAQLRV